MYHIGLLLLYRLRIICNRIITYFISQLNYTDSFNIVTRTYVPFYRNYKTLYTYKPLQLVMF
nr:MAG TPA: hypothetical protein [Caudoviricetes sp.]